MRRRTIFLLIATVLLVPAAVVGAQASDLGIKARPTRIASGSAAVARPPVEVLAPRFEAKVGEPSLIARMVVPLSLKVGAAPLDAEAWLTVRDGTGRAVFTSARPVFYRLGQSPVEGIFELGDGLPRAAIASYAVTVCARGAATACR